MRSFVRSFVTMAIVLEAPVESRCRHCGTAIEQPPRGGRQKLFCSDDHRLRYWRERRRQGLPTGEEEAERRTDVRALSWELQATLLGFQHTVQALAGALADAGDMDAARAAREQAETEAQRRIAVAEERRARAERMRLDAEALSEAANAAATDAQHRSQEAETRAGQAAAEARAATERAETMERRLQEEVEAAARAADELVAREREKAAARIEAAEAEARHLADSERSFRARADDQERELESLRARLAGEQADRHREAADHVARLESLHAQLRDAEGALATERELRLRAESAATAATELAEERARQRDRALRALKPDAAPRRRRIVKNRG